MDIKEFRELDSKAKVKLVNERLAQIKTAKEFKCKELEFSYTTALEEMHRLSYERRNNEFVRALTQSEVEKLLELLDHYGPLLSMRSNLGASIKETRETKTTTVNVDKQAWESWQAYCKKHSDFSAPALLSAALRSFMLYN